MTCPRGVGDAGLLVAAGADPGGGARPHAWPGAVYLTCDALAVPFGGVCGGAAIMEVC
jgi:hypothetical protein